MGTEASKPMDGPAEFGQSGNDFQVISPMSDLSCPSDIHRLNKNRNLHKMAALPNRKKANGGNAMAPGHFYFPTKETERAVERAERRSQQEHQQNDKENQGPKFLKKTKKILKKTKKVVTGCFTENGTDVQVDLPQGPPKQEDEVKHYNGTLGIARKVVPKKCKSFDEFCDGIKHTKSQDSLARTAPGSLRPNMAKGHSFVIREAEGLINPEQFSKPLTQTGTSATLQFAGAILHEADDYFTRLSAGGVEESPYIAAKALGREEPDSPISNLFEDNMSGTAPSKNSEDSSLAESDFKRTGHSPSPAQDHEAEFASPADSLVGYQQAIGTIAETPGYYPEDSQAHSEQPKRQIVLKPSSRDVAPYASREMVEQLAAELAPTAEQTERSSSSRSYGAKAQNTNSAFRVKNSVEQTAAEEVDKDGHSKLESLFRPVLPALSADDAETMGSYDPWVIKVTESAPGVIESKDYKELALRRSESPEPAFHRGEKLGGSFSPSMLSIDSQVDATPAKFKATVSAEAQDNAQFLFSQKGRAFLVKKGSSGGHDAGTISTYGSRSRVSSRGTGMTGGQFTLMDAVSGSVRLAPKESIDLPVIESKMSDLTEASIRSNGVHSSILKSYRYSTGGGKKRVSFGGVSAQDGEVGETKFTGAKATPYSKASFKNSASNSPFLRFQSARTMFENPATVEVSAIQNKFSDITDDRESVTPSEYDETLASEAETMDAQSIVSASMRSEPHWAYNENDDSVTPAFNKAVKNTTKSPFRRFENAKSKFGQVTVVSQSSSPSKKSKAPSPQKKLPFKSPRSSRAKVVIKKSPKAGGSVASKIQDLNQRVVAAKIDRKKHRWTKSNPRKYGVIESNAVRTRALMNYKASAVGFDQINYMAAAKFNSIPIEDDDSIDSMPERGSEAHFENSLPPLLSNGYSEQDPVEEDDDDEVSKLTADTATVATIRQEHVSVPGYSGARLSAGSLSTASSGFSKIKKQVFRPSHVSSASTTMSAILDKENSNLPFRTAKNTVKPTEQSMVAKPDLHLSPTQRTPMQAQKWRTLAAAAHKRDSQKKTNRVFRGLSIQQPSKSHFPAY